MTHETLLFDPPAITLPRADVPETNTYWQGVNSFFTTGTDLVEQRVDDFCSLPQQRVAMDIETQGVDEGRWQITCVTASWRTGQGIIQSVLLNPLRNDRDRGLLRRIVDHAGAIVFHNAIFDIPPLCAHRLFTIEDIDKVEDTLLLARMLRTVQKGSRNLESLGVEYGITDDSALSMPDVFKIAGFRTQKDGYENCDVTVTAYRNGAMSDTAVTLQLWDQLYPKVVAMHTLGMSEAGSAALLTFEQAEELVWKIQQCSRVMLKVEARGLAWDRDYRDEWFREQEQSVDEARRTLEGAGLSPGNGGQLVRHLHDLGELPGDWPRTDKGALKSDKNAMKLLTEHGHPLSAAHTVVAEFEKNANYMKQIETAAFATGRVHAATQILGAHASGRTSVVDPPLQQFSADARPVITSDGDKLWSVDWSSIEPVVLANCAGDRDFITPFNEGGDLYIPLARRAGLIPNTVSDEEAAGHPGRKKAKTILLAAMYGQGTNSLAAQMGITPDEAYQLQDSIRQAMRTTFDFMNSVRGGCKASGFSYTIMGRMLDERLSNGEIMDRTAVNHFCQGSSADILMEAVLELDRRGASKYIKMLIHDEIVIEEPGLDECKDVMTTVPQVFADHTAHTGMTPVLRIDAQCMDHHWQKV